MSERVSEKSLPDADEVFVIYVVGRVHSSFNKTSKYINSLRGAHIHTLTRWLKSNIIIIIIIYPIMCHTMNILLYFIMLQAFTYRNIISQVDGITNAVFVVNDFIDFFNEFGLL